MDKQFVFCEVATEFLKKYFEEFMLLHASFSIYILQVELLRLEVSKLLFFFQNYPLKR
jgi:hypothetical protein